MLIDNLQVRRRLRRMVAQLTNDAGLREDLMQEAVIRLWRLEEERPGQSQCWYLQGCRYHLQNHLRSGRSVDSTKHAWRQKLVPDAEGDGDSPPEWPNTNGNVWEEISANDILSALAGRLTDPEQEALQCLVDGLSARQVADHLNRSHTLVNRMRQRIAAVAVQLGITGQSAAPARPPIRVQ